jgi:hypothetical protein
MHHPLPKKSKHILGILANVVKRQHDILLGWNKKFQIQPSEF